MRFFAACAYAHARTTSHKDVGITPCRAQKMRSITSGDMA